MDAIKMIKPSSKYISQQYTIGGIATGLGVLTLFAGIPYPLGIGILVLVIASIQKDRTIIKVFDSYIETKFAPAASRKFIKFKDLEKLDVVSEKKIFLYYREGEKLKKLRLPVHLIEKEDLGSLIELFRSKMKVVA